MAFISPVIRRDFNVYETAKKKPQQRSRTMSKPNQVAPKLTMCNESTSLDSLLDRQKQLLMIRERRLQKRSTRRSNTLNFRQISVITETDEENEEASETTRNNSTNQLACATIEEQSEDEQLGSAPSLAGKHHDEKVIYCAQSSPNVAVNTESTKNKKKSVIEAINHWVRSYSLRRKKAKSSNSDRIN